MEIEETFMRPIDLIKENLASMPGWRTNRRIVVIESDDWGSIRMPSKDVYELLISRGIRVNNLAYNRYDALACEKDLASLFTILNGIKDVNGNSPVFTANTIVGNPDFMKIRKSNFKEYAFEPFTETLKKYPQHLNSFKIWEEGITAGVFNPQFHGREHINVNRWMKALQANNQNVLMAFDLGLFDLSVDKIITENSFMDALNFTSHEEIDGIKQSISDGLDLFYSIFGYWSQSFVAPSYIWPSEVEETLFDKGVRFIQSARNQLQPLPGKDHKFRKYFHYTGEQSKSRLTFIVRNASFEPSERPDYDWMDDVLARAKMAFNWGKPLVISSHRVNYIGYIDPINREKNLPRLKQLLKSLLRQWPDIEFLSTSKLGELVNAN